MPRIGPTIIPRNNATGYPAPYAKVVGGRWVRRLGPESGLSDFGIGRIPSGNAHYSDIELHWSRGSYRRKDESRY